jgi:DNA-binding transcriptional regulator YiaG
MTKEVKNKSENKLRILREQAGLSMSEAAFFFNTSYRTWQNWEMGHRRIPEIAIKALRLYIEHVKPKNTH